MTSSVIADSVTRAIPGRRPARPGARAHGHLALGAGRRCQVALGLLWLLDGILQFRPFMYSGGFVRALAANAAGQPAWLSGSIMWGVHAVQTDLAGFNTTFALLQVALGLGLLYRRTVKPALAASIAWALVVWWFGEAFGMLFMSMGPPLTGAPGAAALYVIIALVVWPSEQPGGLLGARGARLTWAALWLVISYLWLSGVSTAANSMQAAIASAPSGMGWLTSLQRWVAGGTQAHGLVVALLLALTSAVIGVTVAAGWWARPFLWLSVVLNLAYWVVGQGFGAIFTSAGTDPGTGPLFVLLAVALYATLTARVPGAANSLSRPG